MEHRIQKLESQLQQTLAELLQSREHHSPKTIVTVTDVDVSPDRHYATVSISVYPDENERPVLEGLQDDIGAIQHTINNKLRIRPVPKLTFAADHKERAAAEVEEILEEEQHEE